MQENAPQSQSNKNFHAPKQFGSSEGLSHQQPPKPNSGERKAGRRRGKPPPEEGREAEPPAEIPAEPAAQPSDADAEAIESFKGAYERYLSDHPELLKPDPNERRKRRSRAGGIAGGEAHHQTYEWLNRAEELNDNDDTDDKG